ncbi:lipase-like, putative [Bodo saltans]|uniref:Lipase-like, putative n=1 Tax=Bodo saltans TaxID=75058 RepID=A0A0S4J2I9_BODSA|nr:lipase-like, putative [Bodo saltans]|eukprot:CUG64313.1 lipase-like, putative [Bodo saltans]
MISSGGMRGSTIASDPSTPPTATAAVRADIAITAHVDVASPQIVASRLPQQSTDTTTTEATTTTAPGITTIVQAPCFELTMKTLNVLCFGDSLTYGNGSHLGNSTTNTYELRGNYPMEIKSLLQSMLLSRCRNSQHSAVSRIDVFNLGLNGVAVSPGRIHYGDTTNWKVGLRFARQAHIAIFMLGTNDSMEKHWKGTQVFETAFHVYINKLLEGNPKLQIVIVNPPPVLPDLVRWKRGVPLTDIAYGIKPVRIKAKISPMIKSIAQAFHRNHSCVTYLDIATRIRQRIPQLDSLAEKTLNGSVAADEVAFAQSLYNDGLHPTKIMSEMISDIFMSHLVENVFPALTRSVA